MVGRERVEAPVSNTRDSLKANVRIPSLGSTSAHVGSLVKSSHDFTISERNSARGQQRPGEFIQDPRRITIRTRINLKENLNILDV